MEICPLISAGIMDELLNGTCSSVRGRPGRGNVRIDKREGRHHRELVLKRCQMFSAEKFRSRERREG